MIELTSSGAGVVERVHHAGPHALDIGTGMLPGMARPNDPEAIRDFRQAIMASFNAMREDLTDLRTTVDNGFIEMRGKLDANAAGQQQIVGLLNTLSTRRGGQPSGQ